MKKTTESEFTDQFYIEPENENNFINPLNNY